MQVADILAQAQVQAAVVQAMGLVIGLFCVGLGLYCGLSQLARKSDPLSQTSVVFSCLQPRVGEECTCFEANVGHMDACLQRAGNDWSRSNGNGCRGADGGTGSGTGVFKLCQLPSGRIAGANVWVPRMALAHSCRGAHKPEYPEYPEYPTYKVSSACLRRAHYIHECVIHAGSNLYLYLYFRPLLPVYSLQGMLGQPGSLGKSTSVHNSTHLLIVICLQKTLEIQSGKPP